MSSVSRTARIADDAIAQLTAQNFFVAGTMNCQNDVTPFFAYEYDFDIPSTNTEPQIVLAPLDLNPLRKGWGEINTHYRIGFAVARHMGQLGISNRAYLDPLMLCVENICQYLMAATKFDTTAYCIACSAVMGGELCDELRSRNMFLVVVEAEFADELVVSFS